MSRRAPELPFYNHPDFTPEWIAPGDSNYTSIHRIAAFSFMNQEGTFITQQQLQGKVHVANFFFTTCGSICPKMMNNLKKFSQAFADDDRVRMLSYSVLPQTDSVARLKRYATLQGIDSRRWWLLSGNRDKIYAMARGSYFADGLNNPSTDTTDFLHTENCVLVDTAGRIRGVYNATLELEVDKLIAQTRELLGGR